MNLSSLFAVDGNESWFGIRPENEAEEEEEVLPEESVTDSGKLDVTKFILTERGGTRFWTTKSQ